MRSKMLLVVVLALAAAGFAASGARAAVVDVNPFLCQTFQDGSQTVPAGSEIAVRQGFSEQTHGILTALLTAQTTTISVDGTAVDVSDAWSAPEQRPAGGWASFVTYPTGITLAAGESLTVVWTTTLAHRVPEVFNPAGGGSPGVPVLNEGTLTFSCTVAGV